MQAFRQYANVTANTASSETLMISLFETALRNIRKGADHLSKNQYEAASPLLDKASRIILCLQGVLRPSVAPELTKTLQDLYTFVATRITLAICTKDSRYAREAERAFAPIVEGFVHAAHDVQGSGPISMKQAGGSR